MLLTDVKPFNEYFHFTIYTRFFENKIKTVAKSYCPVPTHSLTFTVYVIC